MKNKKKPAIRKQESHKAQLSLMAVQEKLGLFESQQKTKDADYLKDKPLGLI